MEIDLIIVAKRAHLSFCRPLCDGVGAGTGVKSTDTGRGRGSQWRGPESRGGRWFLPPCIAPVVCIPAVLEFSEPVFNADGTWKSSREEMRISVYRL